MKEVWKDVKGYEGYYQVSNCGRVRSVDRVVPYNKKSDSGKTFYSHIKSRMLHPQIDKFNRCPRYTVILQKNHKTTCKSVGTLMAEAFISHKCKNPRLHYKDGNSFNMTLSNMYWVDLAEKHDGPQYVCHGKPVFNKISKTWYRSISDASRKTKISINNIRKQLDSVEGEFIYA